MWITEMIQPKTIIVNAPWDNIFRGDSKAALEKLLPNYVRTCRWFGGKARTIWSIEVAEAIPLPHAASKSYITYIVVNYIQGEPQTYMLPLAYASGEQSVRISEETPHAIVAHLRM